MLGPIDRARATRFAQIGGLAVWWTVAEVAVAAALAYSPAVFFWRLLTANLADQATIPLGDFTELHYPYRSWAAEQLALGHLPTWNPFVSAGHPALGDIQFGLLYPVGWVFAAAFGGNLTYLALEQQVVLHVAIAALGAYLFARVAGTGRAGAIVAALAFAYGGYMTSFPVQQIIILFTSAWLPWILLGIELSIGRREPLAGLLVAGGVAMAALVGHPQTLAYVLGASTAFGLYRAATRLAIPGTIGAAAGGAIGLAVAAPALLPALEHLRLTARTDVGYQFTAHGFSAHEMLGLAYPTDLGGRPLYVGLLVIALAVVGAASRRVGVGFWAGLAAVALLLSLGGNTFLYPASYALVPGLQYFRDHERAAMLVNLALGLLAGYGLRASLGGLAVPTTRVAALLALVVGGAFALFGLLIQYGVVIYEGDLRNKLNLIGDRAFLTALLGALAGALLFALRSRAAHGWLLATGAVVLVAVDLFTAGWQLNLAPGSPETILRPTATTQFLRESLGPLDRVSSEGHLPADGNAGALFRIPDTVGNSPLDLQSYRLFGERVPELERWRMLSVRYITTRRKIDDPRLPVVFREGELVTHELRRDLRLPRAWLVHRAIVATGRDEELELTRRLKPDEEVVVDRAVGPLDGRAPDRPAGEATEAAILEHEPERITVRTWSRRDAVLVLGERDYPGWRATLDGSPAPLLRANHVLRGVYVPSGPHVVELSFEPPGLAAGLGYAREAVWWATVLVAARLILPLLLWGGRRGGVILADRVRSRGLRRTETPPDRPVPAHATQSGEPEPTGGAR